MILKKGSKLGAVLSFIFIAILIYVAAKNFRGVEKIIEKAGFFGPILVILIYGIFSLTPVTTDPLTVVSGVLFGPVLGIVVSWLGNNLASLLEYYIGRRLNKISNFEESRNKLPFGLSKLPVSSPLFLVFGRLIPGYGGKVVSIMAGIYNVPFGKYFWMTAATNFVGSVLMSYGGYHLINLLK